MAWITVENLTRFANGFAEAAVNMFAKETDIPSSLPASGGDADTVSGHTVAKNVPLDAKFTDTVYTHPATAGNKHIPAGGAAGQILRWGADGTAVWGNDNNTTYSQMQAATASAAGKAGLVPAPAAGANLKFLRGDGQWAEMAEATDKEIDAIIAGSFE